MCSGSAAGARWFDLAGLVAWVGLVCAAGSVVWAVPWGLVERVVPWGHSRSIIEVVFAMTGAALRSVFVCGPWSSIAALKPLSLTLRSRVLGLRSYRRFRFRLTRRRNLVRSGWCAASVTHCGAVRRCGCTRTGSEVPGGFEADMLFPCVPSRCRASTSCGCVAVVCLVLSTCSPSGVIPYGGLPPPCDPSQGPG